MKNDVKLYNVIFPFWMLLLIPATWLIAIPGNFIIDSLVLLLGMNILKISDKKTFYKKTIIKIFFFGFLSDIIGSLLLFVAIILGADNPDSLFITIPAIIISGCLIFMFNYFFTFKKYERSIQLKMALIFATVTAPYTFLIPTTWLY